MLEELSPTSSKYQLLLCFHGSWADCPATSFLAQLWVRNPREGLPGLRSPASVWEQRVALPTAVSS